jgi:hypothetical protein
MALNEVGEMGVYRLLADHYVNNQLLQAGSVVTDVGPGAVLPFGWIPSLAVDAQDTDGLQKFFNAGPGSSGQAEHGVLSIALNGNRWSGIPVGPPIHFWKRSVVGGYPVWQVNGAESLGFWNAT